MGLSPGSHTLIGLYSQNCPEWILTEQACYTYSLVVVPLYDTLGPDACAFIINQAEINLVVCENDTKCNLILDKAPRYVIRDWRNDTNSLNDELFSSSDKYSSSLFCFGFSSMLELPAGSNWHTSEF